MTDGRSQLTVVVTRPLVAGALQPLHGAKLAVRQWESDDPIPREVLLDWVRNADGLMTAGTERVDEELLSVAARLKVVANVAVGYDNIDVPACTRHRVVACNTPGILAETTADLTWALLLAVARRLVEGVDYVRQRRWKTFGPRLLLGQDVYGKTLGIVGLGDIGWQVARRAAGFDMRVIYHNRRQRHDLEAKAALEFVDLDTLLRESDFISLHVPLSAQTHHLIGEAQLALMKPAAVLVNVARGGVVDSRALYDACAAGTIGGAGLDVTDPEPLPADDPLLTLPNVVVVPHIGSASHQTRLRIGVLASENVVAVLEGKPPPTPLNTPIADDATPE